MLMATIAISVYSQIPKLTFEDSLRVGQNTGLINMLAQINSDDEFEIITQRYVVPRKQVDKLRLLVSERERLKAKYSIFPSWPSKKRVKAKMAIDSLFQASIDSILNPYNNSGESTSYSLDLAHPQDYLALSNSLFSQQLFTISEGKVVPNNVCQAFLGDDMDHSPQSYHLIDTDTFSLGNNISYEIKAFQNKDDDWESFGDNAFSKMEIACHNDADSTKDAVFTFIDDDMYFRFNYWAFAQMTDSSWEGEGKELCKVIPLSNECAALVVVGMHDSVGPGLFYIFVVYNNSVEMVYRADTEIYKMETSGDTTTFRMYTYWTDYDHDNRTLVSFYNIVFGDGNITFGPKQPTVVLDKNGHIMGPL